MRAGALAALLSASGCIGTVGSRIADAHFGWPWYTAVQSDCLWVSGHNRKLTHDSGFIGDVPLVVYVAFLSVPFDLVIDTVLLPVDVVVSVCSTLGGSRTSSDAVVAQSIIHAGL